MPSAPQGTFDYEGIRPYVTSGQFTLTPGLSPSVCSLSCLPLPNMPPSNGTLVLEYGADQLRFLNCKLDSVVGRRGQDGKSEWQLTIYDRRWMWADRGKVSGEWNKRVNDQIVYGTEKKPSELLKMCLEALGESGFDLSRVPDDDRPYVEWDYTRPSAAMGELCDLLKCIVCLGPVDNKIYIIPNILSTVVFTGDGATEYEESLDPPDPPAGIIVVGSKIKYQIDFPLEAVGREDDGTWKLLDELSYIPEVLKADGSSFTPKQYSWNWFSSEMLNVSDKKLRTLGEKYVFKAYRIKPPTGIPGLPNSEIPKDIKAYLPLLNEQVEYVGEDVPTTDDKEKDLRRRSPQVHGFFANDGQTAQAEWEVEASYQKNLKDYPAALYDKGIDLDVERGIVMFGSKIFRLVAKAHPQDGIIYPAKEPAEIYLRVACHISKAPKTYGEYNRFEFTQSNNQGPKAAPSWAKRYEVREDIEREIYYDYVPTQKLVDNEALCNELAKVYWERIASEYVPKDGLSATYVGFRKVGNDGAVRQITWFVDTEGKAFTRISKNREEVDASLSYKERRLIEKIRNSQREEDRSNAKSGKDVDHRKKGIKKVNW
jgi:hypothetical protein